MFASESPASFCLRCCHSTGFLMLVPNDEMLEWCDAPRLKVPPHCQTRWDWSVPQVWRWLDAYSSTKKDQLAKYMKKCTHFLKKGALLTNNSSVIGWTKDGGKCSPITPRASHQVSLNEQKVLAGDVNTLGQGKHEFCPPSCGLLMRIRPCVSFAPQSREWINSNFTCRYVPPVRLNLTCKLSLRLLVHWNLHETNTTVFFCSFYFVCLIFFQLWNRLF